MAIDICTAAPRVLFDTIVCLEPVSKDARGELHPLVAQPEECRELDCKTLKTMHALKVGLASHKCDGSLGITLDGVLVVTDLTTAFVGGDPFGRGVHVGDFRWWAAGALIEGTVSGMTNVGTHRAPVFDPCEECATRGQMEGRLCGRIVRATDGKLLGCDVVGVYLFRFEPTEEGGRGEIAGSFEGAVVCGCAR